MKKYFLQSNGQHIGPYSAEDLGMMSISSSTPVWYDGLDSWKNAGDIPELNFLFVAPPPTPSYYQAPVYQQPVTPYYYPTPSEPRSAGKKSLRNLVLLIVTPIFICLVAVLMYMYRVMQEGQEAMRERTREMQKHDDNDDLDKTFPYSYDTAGIEMQEASPEEASVGEAAPPPAEAFAEVMPEFPGGTGALNRFIRNTIKYPVVAKESGIQGTVYVRFTIEKNGEVTNAKIARGVSPDLDREAMRMVKKMPRWKPGTMNGNPVRIEMTQPIRFVLQ